MLPLERSAQTLHAKWPGSDFQSRSLLEGNGLGRTFQKVFVWTSSPLTRFRDQAANSRGTSPRQRITDFLHSLRVVIQDVACLIDLNSL